MSSSPFWLIFNFTGREHCNRTTEDTAKKILNEPLWNITVTFLGKILNELWMYWMGIGLVLCPFPCNVLAVYHPRTPPLAPSVSCRPCKCGKCMTMLKEMHAIDHVHVQEVHPSIQLILNLQAAAGSRCVWLGGWGPSHSPNLYLFDCLLRLLLLTNVFMIEGEYTSTSLTPTPAMLTLLNCILLGVLGLTLKLGHRTHCWHDWLVGDDGCATGKASDWLPATRKDMSAVVVCTETCAGCKALEIVLYVFFNVVSPECGSSG